MKRVGILTFYFADNYGAVLQTYSLYKVIGSIPGMDVSIVPYVPLTYKTALYWKDEEKYHNKRKAFWTFLREKCGLDAEILTEVNGNGYDIICVGSDQVWNRKCIDSQEYFLPNIESANKKISYAASLGLPLQDVLQEKGILEKYLPDFDSISIREKEHKDFVEKVSGKECAVVLDPTLLVAKDDLEAIVTQRELCKEEFVFLFWLGERNYQAIEFANTMARKYRCKIVHTFVECPRYMLVNDGGCVYYDGVENFLWYIKHAKIVVTDSYHGMCMSIRFEKDFYVFTSGKKQIRFDTVVSELELQERVANNHVYEKKSPINYKEVAQKLNVEQEKSLLYLKKALKSEEGSSVIENIHVRERDNGGDDMDFWAKLVDFSERHFMQSCRLAGYIDREERFTYQYPIIMKYLENKIAGKSINALLRETGGNHVAIYAMTEFAELLIDDIGEEFNLILCDRSYQKFQNGFKGRTVFSMEQLVELNRRGEIDKIIVCSIFHANEVFEQLIKSGIPMENMISVITAVYCMK